MGYRGNIHYLEEALQNLLETAQNSTNKNITSLCTYQMKFPLQDCQSIFLEGIIFDLS